MTTERPIGSRSRPDSIMDARHGKTTKWLTFMSGVVLVAVFLSLFAYGTQLSSNENQIANSNRMRSYETKGMPVPEKRELEDLPEPVPRACIADDDHDAD